jgi:hypothetical protein
MIGNLLENLLDPLDPEGQERFNAWVVSVGNKISEIALELEDEKLIDIILNDEMFLSSNNDKLLEMFLKDIDIEKASYEVLNIMIKNKK